MTKAERKAEAKKAYAALMKYYPLTLEDLDGEQWRDLPDYEGLYQISTFGRLKRFYPYGKTKIIKPAVVRGYLQVTISKHHMEKQFKIHRLVAQVFIPNPEGKPQVNHRDGCKFNNHVSNLEWVTTSENVRHAVCTGLVKKGEDNYQAGVTNEQAKWIREHYKPYDEEFGTVAFSKMFGLSDVTIGYIVHGETYKDAGGKIHKKNQPKIPVEVREEIRRLYRLGGVGYRNLAKQFGCGKTTIKRIIHEND